MYCLLIYLYVCLAIQLAYTFLENSFLAFHVTVNGLNIVDESLVANVICFGRDHIHASLLFP